MIRKKILFIITIFCFLLLICFYQFNNFNNNYDKNKKQSIRLGTTTSIKDSGLLNVLLFHFTKETGIKVDVLSQGTGQAIKTAKGGEVDVLLVHSKNQEEKFIQEGYGIKRQKLMYNDFILVGPKNDSLKIKEKAYNNIKRAFEIIHKNKDNKAKFISRDDGSGTDNKEKNIWRSIKIQPYDYEYYISSGKGMAAALEMASELQGYIFTDRSTYLSLEKKLDLTIVCEKDKNLHNQYSIITLNYNKLNISKKSQESANIFIKWIFDKKANKLINKFGKEKFGQQLFFTNKL